MRRLGSTRSEPVDVWIVAATSEDLQAATRARRFREDLYHRLAVLTLRMPPLRERGEDIVWLAEHFLGQACADYGLAPRTLAPDARAALLAYPWPGNVRELANTMERVALLTDAGVVQAESLALPAGPAPPREPLLGPRATGPSGADERQALLDSEARAERQRLHEALTETRWNIARAAARLGIPRNTLRYRMEKHGLTARTAGPRPPTEAGSPPERTAPAPTELSPRLSPPRPPACAGSPAASRSCGPGSSASGSVAPTDSSRALDGHRRQGAELRRPGGRAERDRPGRRLRARAARGRSAPRGVRGRGHPEGCRARPGRGPGATRRHPGASHGRAARRGPWRPDRHRRGRQATGARAPGGARRARRSRSRDRQRAGGGVPHAALRAGAGRLARGGAAPPTG